ncbi:MAG: FAD-dependent oxidoreductase [Candidatus Ozemobacteraceae bacterium]
MKEYQFDAVVIGGGAAGMAAAVEIRKQGFEPVIIDREEDLGGILLQCIHNGFGLHEFKEELTGPEYAERFANRVREMKLPTFLETTVSEIKDGEIKELCCYSKKHGVFLVRARAVVLAMGCRERNRGNIGTPGTRPAGIFTAGLAQRLINIDGLVPGKDFVIVGSGDIGLIMARRLKWIGCNVHAVVEIQPYPSGLTRNIVQCLHDFKTPLYLSHAITRISGKNRVEGVDITPIIDGSYDFSRTFKIPCDGLLLSVGLLPENEISRKAGVQINYQHNGPMVDSTMMTNCEGIFACGNVVHVHDLVDFVSEESQRTGTFVSEYLRGTVPKKQFSIQSGRNVRYVVPEKLDPEKDNKFYLRPMIVKPSAVMEIRANNQIIKTITKSHIQPSEMISFSLGKKDLQNVAMEKDPVLEVSFT